jgi:hypothetical protein
MPAITIEFSGADIDIAAVCHQVAGALSQRGPADAPPASGGAGGSETTTPKGFVIRKTKTSESSAPKEGAARTDGSSDSEGGVVPCRDGVDKSVLALGDKWGQHPVIRSFSDDTPDEVTKELTVKAYAIRDAFMFGNKSTYERRQEVMKPFSPEERLKRICAASGSKRLQSVVEYSREVIAVWKKVNALPKTATMTEVYELMTEAMLIDSGF